MVPHLLHTIHAQQVKSMHSPKISLRIKEAMRIRRIRQPELAASVGVSQSTISRWIDGRPIPDDKFKRLAEALSVSPDWLKLGTGEGPQKQTAETAVCPPDFSRLVEPATAYSARQRSIVGAPSPVVDAITLMAESLSQETLDQVADTLKASAKQFGDPDEEILFSTITFLRRIKSQLN